MHDYTNAKDIEQFLNQFVVELLHLVVQLEGDDFVGEILLVDFLRFHKLQD